MASQKSPSTSEKRAKIGLFTGTFDPLTNGHLDIIARASQLFDKLYVGIFKNDSKNPMFTTDERRQMLEKILVKFDNVEIIVHERDLTVNIAEKLAVTALVRSIRNAADLDYEKNMIVFNREMTGIETVLLVAKPELEQISSSRIKELFSYGQTIEKWVPAEIVQAMKEKNEK